MKYIHKILFVSLLWILAALIVGNQDNSYAGHSCPGPETTYCDPDGNAYRDKCDANGNPDHVLEENCVAINEKCTDGACTYTTCKGQLTKDVITKALQDAGYPGPYTRNEMIKAYNNAACPSPQPVPSGVICDSDPPLTKGAIDPVQAWWKADCTKFCPNNNPPDRGGCPKNPNIGHIANVDTTAWCYDFGTGSQDVNRCLRMEAGRACTLPWTFSTNLSTSCTICIAKLVRGAFDSFGQGNCSDRRIANHWCSGGLSDQGKKDCEKEMATTCASACAATPPPPPPPPPPPGGKTQYRVSETPSDLDKAAWIDYTADPTQIPFSLADSNPGKKFVWVDFKSTTGQTQRVSASIDMVGPDATFGLSCNLSPDGTLNVTLQGTNFGATQGTSKVTINGNNATIINWKDDNIKAQLLNTPSGNQKFTVSLQKSNATPISQECTLGILQLSLGAKLFCHAPNTKDIPNVEIGVQEATGGGKPVFEKVSVSKEGNAQLTKIRIQEDRKYKLSIKAPKSVRRVVEFTGSTSTNVIPNFTLPVGDIFPADDPDGKINSLDKGELNRQWVIGVPAQGRSGDFNLDTRVNSIDWACMRDGFNKEDDPELK